MNGQRPNGPRRPTGGPQNTPPRNRPAPRPDPQRQRQMHDALNERYEEMVPPGKRAADINRGKYADLSTFESRGHRKIDPAVMRAKRRKELLRKYIPVAVVVLIAFIALWVYLGVMRPASVYEEAIALFEKEDYSAAEKIFNRLEDYKDTRDYIAYIDGREAYKKGDYATAKTIFDSLGGFYDSTELALSSAERMDPDRQKEADYNAAMELLIGGEYAAAKDAFLALGSYNDSAEKALLAEKEISYAQALRLLTLGDEAGAKELFLSLGDFRDSQQRIADMEEKNEADEREQQYASGVQAVNERDWRTANIIFNELGSYKDSKTYADYTYAMMCYGGGDYGTAMTCFEACGDFLDSADLLYDARYQYAMSLYRMADETRLPEVIELFSALGSYSDSADMLYSAKDQYKSVAIFAYYDGDLQRALSIFESLTGHPECDAWADKIRAELA